MFVVFLSVLYYINPRVTTVSRILITMYTIAYNIQIIFLSICFKNICCVCLHTLGLKPEHDIELSRKMDAQVCAMLDPFIHN